MTAPARRIAALAVRAARLLAVVIGPAALTLLTLGYFFGVYTWVRFSPSRPGYWAVSAVVPPLIAELAFTRWFERRQIASHRRWVLAGLAGRVAFLFVLSYYLVALPVETRGTIEPVAPLFGKVPLVARLAWLASPRAAVVAALVCAGAYLEITVRRRWGRLSTTFFGPAVATVALSLLLYERPGSGARGPARRRSELVRQVWSSPSRDHRYPREVVVSPDERHAVATFGSTLQNDDTAPPPNELDMPYYSPTSVRRNAVLIDLATGRDRPWAMHHTRRIYGDGDDRVFVIPWQSPWLLEIGFDGALAKHELPRESGGALIDEINFTAYFSGAKRVIALNNKNPVVLSFDLATRRFDRVRSLVGSHGVQMGDNLVALAQNPRRGRLYVLSVAGRHHLFELDLATLEPLRAVDLPADGTDVQVSPDGDTVAVSSFFTEHLFWLDAEGLGVKATTPAPLLSRRIAFSHDGSTLFAASYITGELAVFDAATRAERGRIYVGPRLEGMHVTDHAVYVLSAEGLFRVPLDALGRLLDEQRRPG